MVSRRKSRLTVFLCPLALAPLVLASPCAKADEIVAITDERGRTVYINTGSPLPRATPPTRLKTPPVPNPASPATSTKDVRPARQGSLKPDRGASSPSASAGVAQIDDLIEETAARYHVDPQLIEALVRVESNGDPRALSPKGAMGLMQLIPATAQRFGVSDPYDARENVEGGVAYLRYLLDLFGGDVSLTLAGYNAGENSVLRNGGIPPYRETQSYVRRVSELYTSGSESARPAGGVATSAAPIYRYVDDQGVLHYANE